MKLFRRTIVKETKIETLYIGERYRIVQTNDKLHLEEKAKDALGTEYYKHCTTCNSTEFSKEWEFSGNLELYRLMRDMVKSNGES
jgi:hypothetical protein